MNIQMKELHEQLQSMPQIEEELKKAKLIIEEETRHLRAFESDLKAQLIEDGLWDENEKLNLKFSENSMDINGKQIKGKQFEKYKKIREEHFPYDDDDFDYNFNSKF